MNFFFDDFSIENLRFESREIVIGPRNLKRQITMSSEDNTVSRKGWLVGLFCKAVDK